MRIYRNNGTLILLPAMGRYTHAEDAHLACENEKQHVVETNYACDKFMIGREVCVGDYLNYHGYSDINPFKILKLSPSGKTATIAEVEATRDPTWKPEMVSGGFVAHTVNNSEQRWIYGGIFGVASKVQLGINGWARGTYKASDRPIKFHDYNF